MWEILNRVLNGLDPTPVTPAVDPVAAPAPITVTIVDPTSANPNRPDLVEPTVDGIAAAKDAATWLTKGVNRNTPATAVLLKDCTDDHLTHILLNKPNLSADYRRVIESLLTDRGVTIPTVPPPAPVQTAPATKHDPNAPVSDLNQIV